MSDITNQAERRANKHRCDAIRFFVNGQNYETMDHTLTGLQIKQIAGVPPADELFLEADCGDDVVPNDTRVLVRKNDRFHSMPSPQYGGLSDAATSHVGEVLAIHPGSVLAQADGWNHLVLESFSVPPPYSPQVADLLVKLPPLYPMAPPDMFWLRPAIRLADGTQPQSTSMEIIDGQEWQRFSWHLPSGLWQPAKSTLRDYLRVIVARFGRGN